MAQVRKFNTGGAAPKDLFNIGNRLIDKDDLVYLAKKNLNTFLSNSGIEGEEAVLVKNSFNNIISKIDNKEITSIGEDGSMIDPSGTLTNTTEGFDANGSVVTYLNQLASRINTYKEAAKTKYTDKKERLWEIFTNDFFGGNFSGSADDLKLWTSQGDLGSKFAVYLDKYKKEIEDSDYDWEGSDVNKEDILKKIETASTNLRNGKVDETDVADLVKLGIPSAQAYAVLGLLTPAQQEAQAQADLQQAAATSTTATAGVSTTPSFDLTRQAAIDAKVQEYKAQGYDDARALEMATMEVDSAIKATQTETDQRFEELSINNELLEGSKNYKGDTTYLILTPGEAYHDEWYTYNQNLGLYVKQMFLILDPNAKGKKNLIEYLNSYTKGSVQRRMSLAALRTVIKTGDPERKITLDLGNGEYALKRFFNPKSNSAWIFDTKTNTLKRVKISDNTVLKGYYKEYRKTVQSNKEGGILFASLGDELYAQWQKNNALYLKELKQIELKRNEKLAEDAGKSSVKEYKHDSTKVDGFLDGSKLTASDWTRIGAAVADLTGAVASFIPGGSIYSFVQGLGSDIARTGADLADGMSWGSAMWGLAKGAGLTLITSIPVVGTEGKLAKAFKVIKTLLPWALTAWAGVATAGPAKKSFDNIEAGKGTVGDYKNILQFITVVLNGTKLAGNTWKASAMKKAANTGLTEVVLKGKNGNIKVSNEELATLKSATSKADMQAKLKAMPGHENDELDFSISNGLNPLSSSLKADGKSWYNKGVSMSTNPVYDWSRLKPKYNSDVEFMTQGMGYFMPGKVKAWWERINLPSFNVYSPAKTTATQATPQTTTVINPTAEVDEDAILAGTVAAQRNGGKLEYVLRMHRQGGVLKFAKGGKEEEKKDDTSSKTALESVPVTSGYSGVHSTNSNWRNDVFEKYKQYIIDKLSDAGYADWLNQMQDSHYNMYTHAGGESGTWKDNAYKNQEVTDYQNKYGEDNYYNVNGIGNKYADRYDRTWNKKKRDGKDTVENFSDKSKWVDGAFSSITDDRRLLGRKEDWDEASLNEFNNQLKEKGYLMKLHDNNYYYLEPLSTTNTETEPKTTNTSTTTGGSVVNPTNKEQKESPITFNPYDTLSKLGALGKFMYTKHQNMIMANKAKEKAIAAYKDPYEEEAPTINTYNLEAAKAKQSGNLNTEGRKIQNSTSDGIVGVNARQQAAKDAAEAAYKYDNAIDEKVETNKAKEVEVANSNAKVANDVANYNRLVGVTKHDYDIDVDNGRLSADLTNYQNWIDEQIKDFQTKGLTWESTVSDNAQKTQQAIMQYKLSVDPKYLEAKANYQNAIDNKDYTAAQQYQTQLSDIMTRYQTEYYNKVMGQIAKLKGMVWKDIPVYENYDLTTPKADTTSKTDSSSKTGVIINKSGGTLQDNKFKARLKDNERFDKNALKMIENNRKAIENSSAITKAIIMKFIK